MRAQEICADQLAPVCLKVIFVPQMRLVLMLILYKVLYLLCVLFSSVIQVTRDRQIRITHLFNNCSLIVYCVPGIILGC